MRRTKRTLLFCACGLAAALCLGAWGAYRFYRPNCAAAAQYAVQGVDVSEYQGEIDWPALARQGISFAFVKATEGSGYTDPFFAQNLSGAQAAGLYAGLVCFCMYGKRRHTRRGIGLAAPGCCGVTGGRRQAAVPVGR